RFSPKEAMLEREPWIEAEHNEQKDQGQSRSRANAPVHRQTRLTNPNSCTADILRCCYNQTGEGIPGDLGALPKGNRCYGQRAKRREDPLTFAALRNCRPRYAVPGVGAGLKSCARIPGHRRRRSKTGAKNALGWAKAHSPLSRRRSGEDA